MFPGNSRERLIAISCLDDELALLLFLLTLKSWMISSANHSIGLQFDLSLLLCGHNLAGFFTEPATASRFFFHFVLSIVVSSSRWKIENSIAVFSDLITLDDLFAVFFYIELKPKIREFENDEYNLLLSIYLE
jgi:hypothetical protein